MNDGVVMVELILVLEFFQQHSEEASYEGWERQPARRSRAIPLQPVTANFPNLFYMIEIHPRTFLF